jgi:hypothetical protein
MVSLGVPIRIKLAQARDARIEGKPNAAWRSRSLRLSIGPSEGAMTQCAGVLIVCWE